MKSKSDWAWGMKGHALNQLKRYDEALAAFAHVPEHSQFALQASQQRAYALRRLDQFKRAPETKLSG